MSYPDLVDDAALVNLLSRKEMLSLRPQRGHTGDPALRSYRVNEPGYIDMLIGKYLKIHSHQLFVRGFLNVNTLYRRLHLSHMTGTGKTLAAIAVAQEFIAAFRRVYAGLAVKLPPGRRNQPELDQRTPSVFVLGFAGTKGAFMRELLRYPEFGFLSPIERAELARRETAATGGALDDIKSYSEYKTMLKKRLSNRNRGGFYRFLGYDEFVNRLFLSDTVKLVDLEAKVRGHAADGPTLEEVIAEHIKNGSIQINRVMVEMFTDSLIIADEIHNTYNMNMKNNRGIALQYVLDTVASVRFLSLSATPINNLPTEAVEFINYLVPPEQKIKRSDVFVNRRTPKPDGIKRLGELSRGRISFLQDVNEEYFPRREFIGETIDVGGTPVPYLKFTPCPMSPLHAETLRQLLSGDVKPLQHDTDSDDGDTTNDETITRVPTDGYAIYDMVYPNPESESVGLFRSADVRGKIASAPHEWRDRVGVSMRKHVVTGSFLLRANIGKYSVKASVLLDALAEIMQSGGGEPSRSGKIMIYHERVRTSGVLFLAELLRANGFADEHSEPVDTTLCAICGRPLSDHTVGDAAPGDPQQHQYAPARFVLAHSEIDRVSMDQSLARFNARDNVHGHQYLILLGSRIIKESYDFKAIQHMIIMSLPTNIPTMLQVFGRGIRKGSHADLPLKRRRVQIRILVSVWDGGPSAASPELQRYIDKLADYKTIQAIELEFNRNAIDADTFRDVIMPPSLLQEYFPDGNTTPVASLGNLYFEPAVKLPSDITPTDVTFRAYRYYDEEIKAISYLIKRLFLDEPVWTYDDLWARVRAPPIGLETNPALFDERNFIIALHNLVERATTIIHAGKKSQADTVVESLFDPSERYIFRGGVRHKIEQVDRYYILFPVADMPDNPLNHVYAEYTEYVRDKERAMILELNEPAGRVLVDADTYLRRPAALTHVSVSVSAYVSSNRAAMNYTAIRAAFISHATDLSDADFAPAYMFDMASRFQISFAEEAIKHGLGVVDLNSSLDPTAAYARVVALLGKFRAMVYSPEIAKYKDTASAYKSGVPKVADTVPLGYQAAKTIRLFDPSADKWIEVSKTALNRHTTFKENDTVIGYLESAPDHMRFKLRKPIQTIKARGAIVDTRTIERGIVCGTKSKQDLLKIIASLGISTSRLAGGDMRVKRLCEIIRDKLVELEMKERCRDSRHKYLYSWWDEMVDLAA